jgi:hypothetical protein
MRFPAKAFPCLLFCVACVTLTPASAHPRAASPQLASHAASTPTHAAQRGLHVDKSVQVARRRTKARHAAPKMAVSSPHDTSNRFLMTQGGRQMTADDFEAWMKAHGIRVAKGTPVVAKAAD